jgi:hypothetical protein
MKGNRKLVTMLPMLWWDRHVGLKHRGLTEYSPILSKVTGVIAAYHREFHAMQCCGTSQTFPSCRQSKLHGAPSQNEDAMCKHECELDRPKSTPPWNGIQSLAVTEEIAGSSQAPLLLYRGHCYTQDAPNKKPTHEMREWGRE